jgi:hypothetical protein
VLSFSSPRRESASIGASGKFHGFETYTNDESGIKRRPEDQAGTLQRAELRAVTIKPRQKLVSRK